jgi:tRNA-dihydrouridine synthase B
MIIAEKIGLHTPVAMETDCAHAWIGGIAPASRAFLAPLSGVTDSVMRRIALRHGAGLVVSEMVASDEFVLGNEEARLRSEGSGIVPHVVQIAGCEARWMGEAARLAEASGAHMIDINMGCPAKRVTGGLSGSALMRDLDHALTLITAVVGAVKCPVSVKMRLGWDHASANAPELARRAEAEGVAMVTVHGRTRQQFYKGQADWAAIAAVKAALTIPLVANGDIHDLATARECLTMSAADFVMIGRAAIGQPWLVGEIGAGLAARKAVTLTREDRLQIAIEHYEGLLALMGLEVGVRHARKHLAAYAEVSVRASGADIQTLRERMLTTLDPQVAIQSLMDLFHNADMEELAA